MKPMQPTFLIIGAMKAGTSTLRDLLRGHSEVYVAPKELHYFSSDGIYARGHRWYLTQFDESQGARAVGEKTASYCTSEKAALRIRKDLPEIKLIWLFREPVSRSYSHYWHSVQRGREAFSFADAIAREVSPAMTDRERAYLKRSQYAEQVERYLSLFRREQMLFLLFEELVRAPDRVMTRVLDFLEVSTTGSISGLKPQHSHPTYGPRSPRVQWLADRIFGRRSRGWSIAQRLNRRNSPGYPPLESRLREELSSHFIESNRKLSELTGLDLSCWTTVTRTLVRDASGESRSENVLSSVKMRMAR